MLRLVLAIDPGPAKSGWVIFGADRVHSAGITDNVELLERLDHGDLRGAVDEVAIEMVASYGMPVGREVFETCVWIGRFAQAWHRPDDLHFVYRRDVKLELCGNVRAKDANVRQALMDRIGKPGTKRDPGPTYGVSGDMWAALGVAVVAMQTGCAEAA